MHVGSGATHSVPDTPTWSIPRDNLSQGWPQANLIEEVFQLSSTPVLVAVQSLRRPLPLSAYQATSTHASGQEILSCGFTWDI